MAISSAPQKALYQLVLDANLAAIAAVKVGTLNDPHRRRCCACSQRGWCSLALLIGEVDALIESGAPPVLRTNGALAGHGRSRYWATTASTALARIGRGMVPTIEPGFYIAPMTKPSKPNGGIGIRIEDDVVVTKKAAPF